MKVPKIGPLLKSNFFAGLFILIPLGVIAWIAGIGIRAVWGLLAVLPDEWRPETFIADPRVARLFDLLITVGVALVLALGISLLGWASKQYLGKKALELLSHFIQRIPVLRSVYSALDQLMRAVAAGGGQQFSRVVYVEYPRKEMWTLAFVTSSSDDLPLAEGSRPSKTRYLNIYVPTTPNPTSGFYLIVAENEVRESHLKVEEAFKVILSLGIANGGAAHGTSSG